MEYCHEKRLRNAYAKLTSAVRGWGILCIKLANLFRKLSSQEFHDLFVCEYTVRGGRVTLVLLTFEGESLDHHEDHLRPQ